MKYIYHELLYNTYYYKKAKNNKIFVLRLQQTQFFKATENNITAKYLRPFYIFFI